MLVLQTLEMLEYLLSSNISNYYFISFDLENSSFLYFKNWRFGRNKFDGQLQISLSQKEHRI